MSVLDLSAGQYHADEVAEGPTLSASIAKVLLNQSPAHARAKHPRLNPDWQPDDAAKFEFGTAIHQLFLEGLTTVATIAADDWRTKTAQEFRQAMRDNGRIPMLAKDWQRVQDIVTAAQEQLERFDEDPPLFANGKAEQTIVWEDRGVACRARLDWLHNDYSTIEDVKSTARSANPEQWSRQLYSMGYELQAEFYARGVQAMTGVRPDYRLVVIEIEPPFGLSVIGLPPAAWELAALKIDTALDIWRTCLTSGEWPGYPTRIAYADQPGWMESAWFERVAREEITA